MGNCGYSPKRNTDVHEPQARPRGPNLHITRGVNCPRCGMFFPPSTTYAILNNHVATCLMTDESMINNSNFVSHDNDDPNNQNMGAGSNSMWVKRIDENKKSTWEKVAAISTKTADHLQNMSLKSALELSFEDRKKWFKFQMDNIRIPWVCGADHLNISHANVVESAMATISKMNLHKEVKIVFEEEKFINDAGGLLREFVHLVCLEVFKPERKLFRQTETEEVIYRIDDRVEDTQAILELFYFVGKVIGKAVFEQISLPFQFHQFITKQIIGEPFDLDDLTTYDHQLYNSLKFLRENSIDNSDVFEEYFVVQSPIDGAMIELVEGGSEKRITDENKEEYIDLMLEWLGKASVEKKLKCLLKGIFKVVPQDFFKVFNLEEVEMVLYGLPFIDVNDWENNTSYKGSYYKNHQIVRWFWECIQELDQQQLSKFFYFCTGSTRPPIEGFRSLQSNRGEIQKFHIESTKYKEREAGLKAHTCFNRLELPMFPSKELVRNAVQNILHIDFCGVFGLE